MLNININRYGLLHGLLHGLSYSSRPWNRKYELQKSKTEKVGLLLSHIKPTCCKNVLYGRHFLMLFLRHGKELESFIFFGTKAQIFGDKKDIVSVPYIIVFGFLTDNSLSILKSDGIVSLILKTLPNECECN